MSRVLVTGVAGFIGFHVARTLLARGDEVIGVDNLNDYYDVRLKQHRLAEIEAEPNFEFHLFDVADRGNMATLFEGQRYDGVIHLAAQAGVRYSLSHPQTYIDSNLVGFGNILEGCRQTHVPHLVYASSSSVYGLNTEMPFSVTQSTEHPVSLYAATKKANELMAHSYSHLYALPTTGLRFFTVYGPWGRPDMAVHRFTKAILQGQPIELYNSGKMRRDFTYVDDIVDGVVRVLDHVPTANPAWDPGAPCPSTSCAPYRVYNIGNNQPVELLQLVETLERLLGKPAERKLLPLQPGDVLATWAEVSDLTRDVGFEPRTSVDEGLSRFVEWYRDYYE
ncbi:MAG: NAD-dependent epimerase [Planctomycetaceae bacterium]